MYEVLVAEDEIWIRSAIVKMLETLGPPFKVIGEVSNGEEAWSFIEENWPTILITDIMMPRQDGLWLARQIHERSLPIVTIVVSGYDSFQYAQQAMRFGVTQYLLKPLEELELRQALQSSIKRLEEMSHIRDAIHSIVTLTEKLADYENIQLFQKTNEVIDGIFRLKGATPGIRKSLLTLLNDKMNEMLRDMDSDFPPTPLPADEEKAIRKHMHSLMEAWLLAYSSFASANVKLSIRRVCDYIENRYADNISLTDMASMVHLSVSYFSTLFKRTTGQSFLNYLNQVRLMKAKEMLMDPQLKVYEAAEKAGFTTLSYFNRIFKENNGMTPADYRKRLNI